jgi:hypothetical protein
LVLRSALKITKMPTLEFKTITVDASQHPQLHSVLTGLLSDPAKLDVLEDALAGSVRGRHLVDEAVRAKTQTELELDLLKQQLEDKVKRAAAEAGAEAKDERDKLKQQLQDKVEQAAEARVKIEAERDQLFKLQLEDEVKRAAAKARAETERERDSLNQQFQDKVKRAAAVEARAESAAERNKLKQQLQEANAKAAAPSAASTKLQIEHDDLARQLREEKKQRAAAEVVAEKERAAAEDARAAAAEASAAAAEAASNAAAQANSSTEVEQAHQLISAVKAAVGVDLATSSHDGHTSFTPVTLLQVYDTAKLVAGGIDSDNVSVDIINTPRDKYVLVSCSKSGNKGIIVVKKGTGPATNEDDKVAKYKLKENAHVGMLVAGGPIPGKVDSDSHGGFAVSQDKGFDLMYCANADKNPIQWGLHVKVFVLRVMHTEVKSASMPTADFFALVKSAMDGCGKAWTAYESAEKLRNQMIKMAIDTYGKPGASGGASGDVDGFKQQLIEFAQYETTAKRAKALTKESGKKRVQEAGAAAATTTSSVPSTPAGPASALTTSTPPFSGAAAAASSHGAGKKRAHGKSPSTASTDSRDGKKPRRTLGE